MTIGKAYLKGVLLPAGILPMIVFLYSVTDNFINGSKGAFLNDSLFWLFMIIPFVFSLTFSILGLSMFINLFKPIRSNKVLHFLSWFLLPVAYMLYSIYYLVIQNHISFELNDMSLSIIYLPFIVGLVYTYRKYKVS